MLATPLISEGAPIGAILIRRIEVSPFSDKQISSSKPSRLKRLSPSRTFDCSRRLQERNAELREALEHQTATAEVLGIISRSPTDVQPVLDAIVESAAKVCGIDDVVLRLPEGNAMVPRAHFGTMPVSRAEPVSMSPVSLDTRAWRAPHSRCPCAERFSKLGFSGSRLLMVPLRQQGELIGTLIARRTRCAPSRRRRSSS